MPPPSPVVALIEFGLRVSSQRRDQRFASDAVSRHLGVSRVYYSAVESFRVERDEEAIPRLLHFEQVGLSSLSEVDSAELIRQRIAALDKELE